MSLNTKSNVRTIVEIVIILVAFLAVAIEMGTQRSIMSGIKLLNYYTIQSNIVVVGVMIFAFIKGRTKSEHDKNVGFIVGAATLWILVTGLIYHFMLSGIYQPEGLKAISNVMLHYWTPSLMMIYYLVFLNKNVVNMRYPIFWTGYPLIYGVGSLLRGEIDGFYPYWFMRPYGSYPEGNGSYLGVLLFIAVMAIAFLLLGYLLLFIKKVITPFIASNSSNYL